MKKSIEKSLNTTAFAHKGDTNRKWHLINAEGKVLGRLASEIARLIRGKHNPKFTPNVDTGDFVIVINAGKVKLTGKRVQLKEYIHHSMYPGGRKVKSFKEVIEKHPEKVIRNAVKGMLPKNRLGSRLITKLKIYAGSDHPHKAQQPVEKVL